MIFNEEYPQISFINMIYKEELLNMIWRICKGSCCFEKQGMKTYKYWNGRIKAFYMNSFFYVDDICTISKQQEITII